MCQKGKASVSKNSHNNDVQKESAALKMEREVTLGDLIWVKLHGKSWWPALVVGDNHVINCKKPRKRSDEEVLVRQYGTYEYLYVDPMKYYSEFKVILEQNNGSYREIFHKAIEQKVSRRKSNETKHQESKSTANEGGDASKGSRKLNQNQVKEKQVDDSSPINANDSKACSKIVEANGKLSKQNKLKRKRVSDEGEENARRKIPRRNGSNEGEHKESKQKTGTKGDEQAKKKEHKPDGEEKKVKNGNVSANNDVKDRSPRQGGKKYNTKSAKEVVKQNMEQKKTSKSSSSDKGKHGKNTDIKTPKQDKLLKEKSNSDITPGESPKSSARRTRVMRGLGLMAPTGSPFNKNGLN